MDANAGTGVWGGAGSDSNGITDLAFSACKTWEPRAAEVVPGMLSPQLQAIGNVERAGPVCHSGPRRRVHAERLYVRASLTLSGAGQPFTDVYVPAEWVAASRSFWRSLTAGDDLALVCCSACCWAEQALVYASPRRVHPAAPLTVPTSCVVAA
jgi:hypothetical protein